MERAVMKVVLNTEDKGEVFLIMTKEGGILLALKDLIEMGLMRPPEAASVLVEGDEHIPLSSLSPGLVYEVDEKELAVRLTAQPGLFEKKSIDLSGIPETSVSHLQHTTGFINYGISYVMDGGLDMNSLSMPLEAGLSVSGALLYSSFSYLKTPAEEKLVRLFSNLTLDSPASARRFVAGDLNATSGQLGSSAALAGFSVFRNFSLSPYYVKSSGLDISGVLSTPSEVDIYINGNRVTSETLPPGEFTLMNVPNVSGSGDAQLVIKDAFGKVEKLSVPFYLSTALLKPGVSEYGYSAGFKRENLGLESLGYGGAAFLGFHRLGVTRYFTAGLRAEADSKVINTGASASFLLGRAGEADAAGAISNHDGTPGWAWSLAYGYAGKSFNAGASARAFSKLYSNINLSPSQARPRLERTLRAGYNHRAIGSVSAALTQTDNYEGADSTRASVFYSTRISKDVSFFMTAGRTKAETEINDAFAGLIILFGENSSGGLNYQWQDASSSQAVFLNKNAPAGTGTGYRLHAERAAVQGAESEFSGSGFVQYNTSRAIFSADVRNTAGQMSYTLNASGGIAFIDRSAYATRPIDDSFALVKVGSIKGVKVYSSNQLVATTGEDGEAIVPGLISYYDNDISIDDTDIPVNYSISGITRHISTAYRGGGVVNFDTARLQGIGGRLFVVEKGEKKEAAYWGLRLSVQGADSESIVGKNGEFYLENIPPGRYPARLFLMDKDCEFDILIPESDSVMLDIGEVSCEIH